jgi:anti-sigma B factor antagonist
LESHVIIRQVDRASVGAAAYPDRAGSAAGLDGGSDVAVMTAERVQGPTGMETTVLGLSSRTDGDGRQVVSVTGELDIATAEQAYAYVSKVIDAWDTGTAPVSVDLSGLTFCDASGLGVLARIARHGRQAGRQVELISPRPSLLKIMRITGLDRSFPELAPARAY